MTTKTNRKQALETKISDIHDMQATGDARQWEACGVHGTDKCTICGLVHHWYRNGQNSPDSDRYEYKGHELSLVEAVNRQCQVVQEMNLGQSRAFTHRELATILHGLRLIQCEGRIEGCAAGDCEHFEDEGVSILTNEEIDTLAETINFDGSIKAKRG